MDETYIKVKGQWLHFYRAVNKHRKTLDLALSEQRDEPPLAYFFTKKIQNNTDVSSQHLLVHKGVRIKTWTVSEAQAEGWRRLNGWNWW